MLSSCFQSVWTTNITRGSQWDQVLRDGKQLDTKWDRGRMQSLKWLFSERQGALLSVYDPELIEVMDTQGLRSA